MTIHKLRHEQDVRRAVDIESNINDLKIWARALQLAVMDAGMGEGEERKYRDGLAILLANLVRDKTAGLHAKYHGEEA